MEDTSHRAIAIVGVGAVLPDATSAARFWQNVKEGRYSISDVDPARWDPAFYYDPDPAAPDKTYSKIGAWVRESPWDPRAWKLPIPPRVGDAMDEAQQWAICCTREALTDYGYPERALDVDRTAVILGNAMAGEKHYRTALRIAFPEYADALAAAPSFATLPAAARAAIADELHGAIAARTPAITEDTMPGELANCMAGRIANLFNFHGPNYVVDAACASAMAAMASAAEGLASGDYDAAIAGGIDRNMGASTYVKFCKIGALSATGTRPYADGADGFVMGEGAAVFLLKRLADAERDGDRIYAVLRGISGASDGRGKGITAPNPIGQRLAIERAWRAAGLAPTAGTLIEGHGTSTRVGDVVEVESLVTAFAGFNLPARSVVLGSVKSNIGHLKGAAGAAGILKAVYALRDKVLAPSLHFDRPNPNIDFTHSPLVVNTELREWERPADGVRRVGVSAFGFGGTDFHAVLEEHVPGRLQTASTRTRTSGATVSPGGTAVSATAVTVAQPHDARPGGAVAVQESRAATTPARASVAGDGTVSPKAPLRGALVLGAASTAALTERLETVRRDAAAGRAPEAEAPLAADLHAPERLTIDYGDAGELGTKAARALQALAADNAGTWKALRAQGIFRGTGPAAPVAFLFTGQGSQYVNMLRGLRTAEPIVAATFAEADAVMAPILGKPLTACIDADTHDAAAVAAAEEELRQTAITQPAILAVDAALMRLLGAYGIVPDVVMGHSLGEYGALVAAGVFSLADALRAVSARGREMAGVAIDDTGRMAAVFAPLADVERTLAGIDGYVVIANVNSTSQAVIGGASAAVERAIAAFQAAGYTAMPLPVSHAFHTAIVAPASAPLRRTLEQLAIAAPSIPIVGNVTGELYPSGPDLAARVVDLLGRQVAAPVQFVKGLETLYAAGARVFVEVGPKRALQGFADDVLGNRAGVQSLFTNHPKLTDVTAFNQALCGLYAAGLGATRPPAFERTEDIVVTTNQDRGRVADLVENEVRATDPASGGAPRPPVAAPAIAPVPAPPAVPATAATLPTDRYVALGKLFAEFLERGARIYGGGGAVTAEAPVVISGAAAGLPGMPHVFDDENLGHLLRGEQLIDVIPTKLRHAILEHHITRLVKREVGGPTFETIDRPEDVIKLAARAGAFDLGAEFAVPAERLAALDTVTRLAIAAGLEALRDAGIPLVMRYKPTSRGGYLPEGYRLPDTMRDDTGIIFASAFPGYDAFAAEIAHYEQDRARRELLAELEHLRTRAAALANGDAVVVNELDRRIAELRAAIGEHPYSFDRRFLFRILSMGHSQFAELIGARGPNTQVNSACASTTQAIALAEDWIRAERCRRVIIIAADDVTSDTLLPWIGAGFLATGAAATDEDVESAALPFDRRRHGMILGMGAAALVVESASAARERGIQPICEVLGAVTANSAFHGTRLDVEHIGGVMESLVAQAERRWGITRGAIAPEMLFVSHETYTPARGGSAAAEVEALRRVFGAAAGGVVIANTKGVTGHPMAVGIEDVVAVKALETGLVPPVANYKEPDPDLGPLNLSLGGAYPVRYALRLGAGFGSQISMVLLRWVATADGVRRAPEELGYAYRVADAAAWNGWLAHASGHPTSELEVVHRTLRVKDQGPPLHAAIGSATATAEPHTVAADEPIPGATVGSAPIVAADPSPALATDSFAGAASPPSAAAASVRPSDTAPTSSPAPPVPAAAAPPAGGVPADQVRERVLTLIEAKTGYPRDVLDLDLDLEADLGIDTVKQAEMFAAIREAYGIARDPQLKLRDFPTLRLVIQFVLDRRPDLAGGATPSSGAEPAGATSAPTLASATTTAPAAPAASTTAASPVPAAAAAPAGSGPGDEVRERVLTLIEAKTGYPRDVLDLDLDLEADLGIDTVKQAEMFAAIREAYGIARDPQLKLRDFPTLRLVIGFVYDRRPDLRNGDGEAAGGEVVGRSTPAGSASATPVTPSDGTPVSTDGPSAAPSADASSSPLPTDALITDGFPRRVPVAVLRPPLTQCLPTGVTLGSATRVVVAADQSGAGAALARRLKKRGVEVLLVDDPGDATALAERVKAWITAGDVHGVYWLPALDVEASLLEMDLAAWRIALATRVKHLAATMRALYEHVARPGTFLVAATRLGGQHGYGSDGATAPMGGAVTGFTKAYKRERPDALVKAIDFSREMKAADVADTLIAETLRDPAVIEIGHVAGDRWTIALVERSVDDATPALRLDRETVFVVTGAAGSIVTAITADLAAATGAVFHLLDRVPEPDPRDPDLARFRSDRDALKRDLFARAKARGERATPMLVERELAALERADAALQALAAIRGAGATAQYHCVDLTDPQAVAEVIGAIRRQGPIDVLVHAAGLEVSRFLDRKEQAEFDRVFDVKCDGWFNLLHALGDAPLAASAVFSSIAARFGNAGQTDYSAANDLLCKSTAALRAGRPGMRAIAIDWTAWRDIGMAARGSIPQMMAAAGIDMLPPERGIPVLRHELTAAHRDSEVVVAGRLGILAAELEPAGGIDAGTFAPKGPMLGTIAAWTVSDGLTVETVLDPTRQPFLNDHRIDGTPVLPGVMGIEAFAEIAALAAPGWRVAAVEDVEFLAPLKFYRDVARTVVLTGQLVAEGSALVAHCHLRASRVLAGRQEPEWTTHFTGRVRLERVPTSSGRGARRESSRESGASVAASPCAPADGHVVSAADIYRAYFHGPAYRVLDHVVRGADGVTLGVMAGGLPAGHDPAEAPLAMAPRLIELCFQTAGIVGIAQTGSLALPRAIESVRVLASGAAGGCIARVHASAAAGRFDAEVVDAQGTVQVILCGYETVALPRTVEPSQQHAMQAAIG